MRAAIDVLSPFDELLNQSDWEETPEYFKGNSTLYKQQKPAASFGLEIVGTVALFTAAYFANKLFDEFYDRLLKRPVGERIDSLLEKINFQDNKFLEFRDVVYFEDINVAVVVRILTRTPGAERIDAQLHETHRLAHAYLSKHGRKAPVHCHRVVEGEIDVEPQFFLSIEHLRNEEKARMKALRNYGQTKK